MAADSAQVPRRVAGTSSVFTWEDAQQIPRGRYVDMSTAKRWLLEVVTMVESHQRKSYDMTDVPIQHADWRGFLAQEHNALLFIGPGVARFEVRDLDYIDPRAYHWGFVLRRVDGTDAFLVPDVKRVFSGLLKDWIQEPLPMALMRCPLDLTAMTWDPRPTIRKWQATNCLHSAQDKASV